MHVIFYCLVENFSATFGHTVAVVVSKLNNALIGQGPVLSEGFRGGRDNVE